ncbi:MAG: hypothetical protein HYV28_18340 [Ignavibacteriales bacterium]|nr:hypothetical protein [Ignavibacteriales bacterium]
MNESSEKIVKVLYEHHAVDVSMYTESFTGRIFENRTNELLCGSIESYCSILEHDLSEVNKLFHLLQNGYSEFFRNPLTYAVLERIVLPAITQQKQANKRKEIRLWSAACAAGQEPYSLAILLESMLQPDNTKTLYRIFATDQSEEQIAKAGTGIFSASEIGNVKAKQLERWFIKRDDGFLVKPELKGQIDFSVFDLLTDQLGAPPVSIFGDFDIIMCANLLFYYKSPYQEIILNRLRHCLAKGGFLITGETERAVLLSHGFREVYPYSAIFC